MVPSDSLPQWWAKHERSATVTIVRRATQRVWSAAGLVALALLGTALLAGCGGGSAGSGERSNAGSDRQAALEKIKLCVQNGLGDEIDAKTIIPSVMFSSNSLRSGTAHCESNWESTPPDVCFDVVRKGQIITRVSVSHVFGSMSVYTPERCEQTDYKDGRTKLYGSNLGRALLASGTPGVEVCVDRSEKFKVTAKVQQSGAGC